MTTYSPRDAQQRERKSGFQLDALRSPFKEHNNEHITGVEEASGLGGRIGEFKGKIHNDANGKTTSSMMSPTFIPAPQQNPGHEPAEEYKGPRIWRDFVRDWPISSQQLAIFVLFLLLWIMAYAHAPKYAAPETTIMRIAFLFLGAEACGILVTHIHLPDMLGMLIFGVLYENMGWADFTGYRELEAFLRELALINIMLLAGFGLDGHAFKKCWGIILRLVLIPSIAEVGVICALSHYLLGMPWFWGLLLGLLITAVSPNVIVTVMLHLKEEKLGLNKGIHTIIYGMTSSNDIVSIFTFGCILGVIFNQGKFSDAILQGPVGIVVGIVYGYIFGLMLVYLPSRHSKYVNALRFAMTVLGGCVSVMGSRAMGYPSAGALGCVTLAFVAGQLWKKQQRKTHIFPNTSERLDLLWTFLKPVSFALIGKEINLSVLDGRIVGYGLVVIITGCLFRLVTAYFSTARAQLDLKERLYITISSFPKATVQAALGPIALDLARELNSGPEILSLASNILVISVIAIICTAPLGAILMMRLAPVWLKRGEVPEEEEEGVVRIPEHHTEDDDIVMVTLDDNRAVTDSGQTNIAFEHGDR